MKILNSFRIPTLVSFFVVMIHSCSSSDDNNTPADTTPNNITIEAQNSYTGLVNQVFQLDAIIRNSEGDILNNQSVTWSSNNTDIATMTNAGILKIIDAGQVTITATVGAIEGSKSITIQLTPPNLRAFTVTELSSELANQGGVSIGFLDESTMSATYAEFNSGESGQNSTANRDQVYYFFEGTGTLLIDGQNVVITQQSAIYITAGLERQISAVTTNMKVIILESKSIPSGAAFPFTSYSYATMEAPRNPNQNVWNPFLNENTMLFGLYMLPQSVGGDGSLVHSWDEINIITAGSGLFQTDHGNVQVSPGSIVFAREGNPHSFNSLTDDLDILIFWNM